MKKILVLFLIFAGISFQGNAQTEEVKKDSEARDVIYFHTPMVDYKSNLQKNPASLMKSWNYAMDNYGTAFFCRMEKKWESKSGHGIKFRLGDIQTVDYLEGKINLDQTNLRPQ